MILKIKVTKKEIVKLFALLISVITLQGCNSNSSENNEQDWCVSKTYGTFEGITKDSIKAQISFEQITEEPYYSEADGFFISFEMPSGRVMTVEGGSKFMDFLELNGKAEDIKINNPIKLNAYGMVIDGDGYADFNEMKFDGIEITYLNEDEIKLNLSIAKEAIENLTFSKVDDEINSIVLKKTVGISGCPDFAPMISQKNFSGSEKEFITELTELGDTWKIADEKLMLDYILRKPDGTAWGAWNNALKDYGTVFTLDFNNDGEKDICGYFSKQYDNSKELVFKIFLNNGPTYTEVYSKNLTGFYGGDEILFPGEKNDNNILQASYLDMGGYYLFYNKITNEVEQKFYD